MTQLGSDEAFIIISRGSKRVHGRTVEGGTRNPCRAYIQRSINWVPGRNSFQLQIWEGCIVFGGKAILGTLNLKDLLYYTDTHYIVTRIICGSMAGVPLP